MVGVFMYPDHLGLLKTFPHGHNIVLHGLYHHLLLMRTVSMLDPYYYGLWDISCAHQSKSHTHKTTIIPDET